MKLSDALEKYNIVINKETHKIVEKNKSGVFSFCGDSEEWTGPWVEYKGEWQNNPIEPVITDVAQHFNKLYCGANIGLIWAVMDKLSEGYIVTCEHGVFGVMEYWMNPQKNNLFCIGENKYFSSPSIFIYYHLFHCERFTSTS